MNKDYQLVETKKGKKTVTPITLEEAKDVIRGECSVADTDADWVNEQTLYDTQLDWLSKFKKIKMGDIRIYKCLNNKNG